MYAKIINIDMQWLWTRRQWGPWHPEMHS